MLCLCLRCLLCALPSGRQDHPCHPFLLHQLEIHRLFGGIFIRIAQYNPQAAFIGDILDRARHCSEKGVADICNDEADRVAVARTEPTGCEVGPVACCPDRGEHSVAHGWINRTPRKYPGDGGRRYFGHSRYVLDSDRHGKIVFLILSQFCPRYGRSQGVNASVLTES